MFSCLIQLDAMMVGFDWFKLVEESSQLDDRGHGSEELRGGYLTPQMRDCCRNHIMKKKTMAVVKSALKATRMSIGVAYA